MKLNHRLNVKGLHIVAVRVGTGTEARTLALYRLYSLHDAEGMAESVSKTVRGPHVLTYVLRPSVKRALSTWQGGYRLPILRHFTRGIRSTTERD